MRRLRPAFGERKLPRRRIGEDGCSFGALRRAPVAGRALGRPRHAQAGFGEGQNVARLRDSRRTRPPATARAASSKGSKRQPNLAAKSRALSAEASPMAASSAFGGLRPKTARAVALR